MSRQISRTQPRSPNEVEHDRATCAKYASRPTLAELAASGDHEPPVQQGQYWAVAEFAAAMKARREARALSLADLADLTGIDKAALSRLENGVAENPTIATLERIARALGGRIHIGFEEASS